MPYPSPYVTTEAPKGTPSTTPALSYEYDRPSTYYASTPLLYEYLQTSIVQGEISSKARQDLWSLCSRLYTQRGTFYEFLNNPANTTILDGCPLNVVSTADPLCMLIFDTTFDCTFE